MDARNHILMVNDIAFTADGMHKALRTRGWKVDQTNFPLRADHPRTSRLLPAQFFFGLRAAWRSRVYDLLHIHYGYFGLMGRISPRPYVLHCHGTDLRDNLTGWRKRRDNLTGLLRWPTMAALRGAKHIFYATPNMGQYVPPEFAHKASFCPNIINTEFFSPATQPTPNGPARILFISKLDKTKGMDQMGPVLEELCQRDDVAQVSVFGHGNQTDAVKLPDHPKLNRLPRHNHDQMPDLIRAHDIVVGQIQLGVLGMSEMESMACAKPVVASFTYTDAYDSALPLAQADSAKGVLTALDALLKDPAARQKLGNEARDWIVKNHSAEAVAGQIDHVLRSVMETVTPIK